jgi:myo-inositol-1-phosphate synthase
VRLTEFAQRQGEAGPMTHLASFFKDPLGVRVHSFTAQFQMLKDYVARHTKTQAKNGGKPPRLRWSPGAGRS